MHSRWSIGPLIRSALAVAWALPVGALEARDWSPAFERISIDQGLSQSVVTSIHQDQLGFLWFGTQEGLNRFDGRNFRVYRHDPNDPDTLSSSSIEVIVGDPGGRLWLGTDDGGVNVMDPRSGDIRVLRHDPGDVASLGHDRVLDIAFGPDGFAWIGTESGLDRVDPRNWSVQRLAPGAEGEPRIRGHAVTAVLAGDDGIWAGTRTAGVFHVSEGRIEAYDSGQSQNRRLSGDQVTDLARDGDGGVWVTTLDGGLERIAENGVTSPPAAVGMPDRDLTAVWVREDGELLAGSEDGFLYRIGAGQERLDVHGNAPDDPDSIARGTIMDIFVDRSGVLWIGSYTGGISKSKSLSAQVTHGIIGAHDSSLLPDASVRAFWITEEGGAWIGTDGGLAHAPPRAGRYRIYRHDPADADSLSHDRVLSLLERSNGELWVGTQAGLNRYDPSSDSFERFLRGDGRGLPDDRVRDLAEDPGGRMWVGTEAGLARYDDESGRFRVFRGNGASPAGLSSDEITSLWADAEGHLWIGTNDAGLNRLHTDGGELRHYGAGPDGLSHPSVWSVRRIGDTVWVGTFSGGLNRIDLETGEVRHYLERDGLINNVVYQIVPDGHGRLWLSTNAGISVLNPDNGRLLNFNPRDGLRNYEYNSNASFRDSNGRIYFGGIDGFDVIEADGVHASATPARAALTGIELFNRPVEVTDDNRLVELDYNIEYAESLSLGYGADVFSIGLGALHFANPDTNRIRYRIEGLHGDWLATRASQRYVTFNSVPSGEYRLRVQASARGWEWGPERVLDLRIDPPPWRSNPAYAAYVVVALLLAYFGVRGYRRRLQAERGQVARLNRMVAQRTAELESLNERLQSTNRQLRHATRRDPLTGLANRRALLEWLPREQAAALRAWRDWARRDSGRPRPDHARLCFLVVDIDDFKYINDTWGHLAGDEVLSSFAGWLEDHCRDSDLAVRWGGEEFLLVMRSITVEGAKYLAERIRRAVETRPLQLQEGDDIHITCSIGFGFYPFSIEHPEIGDWEDVVGLADAGLYAAKNAGKNAWVGIDCPEGLAAEAVKSLLREHGLGGTGEFRATVWRSGDG